MDFETLLKAIEKCFHSLADMWVFKCIFSVIIAVFTSIHGTVLTAFVALVVIDLFTRWIALCYKHLTDSHKKNDILSCILDMHQAFNARYINSDMMKHRFIGKIIVYMVLTYVAVEVDFMITNAGESAFMLKLVWTYLASTEAISVVENLRDAGIDEVEILLDTIRHNAHRK